MARITKSFFNVKTPTVTTIGEIMGDDLHLSDYSGVGANKKTLNTFDARYQPFGSYASSSEVLNYLQLSGANANRNINLGTYGIKTTGSISGGNIYDTSMTSGSLLVAGTNGIIAQDNNNLFWDQNSKMMGIGTNAGMSGKLNVYSPDNSGNPMGLNISMAGAATSNTGLLVQSLGAGINYGMRITGTPAAVNNYAIYSDAAAKTYFAGNVGIGINPTVPLHVSGSSIFNNGIVNASGAAITGPISGSNIYSIGDVGIGTTSPGSRLEVNGVNTDMTTVAATGQFTIRSSNVTNAQNAGPSLVFRGGYDGGSNWSPYAAIKAFWDTSTGGNANGGISFLTPPATGVLAERMRINSSGNIGIGTANQSNLLEVSGGNICVSGAGVFKKNGSLGVGGTFTTVDSKTVTVSGGIIISIA